MKPANKITILPVAADHRLQFLPVNKFWLRPVDRFDWSALILGGCLGFLLGLSVTICVHLWLKK